MDRPNTKACSHRLASLPNAGRLPRRTSRHYRSRARSCQVVPCPGSRGRLTVKPRAARSSASRAATAGLPVKPWQSSTPTGPPEWSKGSAPGSTGDMVASSHDSARRRIPQRLRTCDDVTVGLLADEVHARDNAADHLPVPRVGGEERAPARPGHPRQQSPVVLRPLLRAVSGARKVTYLGKSEYFTGRGLKGLISRAFFTGVGVIPLDRAGGPASEQGDQDRPAGPGGRECARHLSRGHAQPGRPSVPGQDGGWPGWPSNPVPRSCRAR